MWLTFTDTNNIKLNKVLVHSERLANDIYICHQRFMNDKVKWSKKEKTVASQIRLIIARFDDFLDTLDQDAKSKLLTKGLTVFEDTKTWNQLEYAALNTCKRTGKGIKNAFLTLARLFNNNLNLYPPSQVNLKGYITDIAKLYSASELLFNEYHAFLLYLLESDRNQKKLRDIKASTHATLTKLIQVNRYRKLLAHNGLRAFALDNELLKTASKAKCFNKTHFQLMLSHYDANIFEQKFVNVRGEYQIDFTELFLISPPLFKNIECYSKIIGVTVNQHLKSNSVRDRFSGFKRALPLLQLTLTTSENNELINKGIITLICTEGLLKKLHDEVKLPIWVFSLFYEICKCIYPEKTPELFSFRENQLSFPGIDKNREVLCDFSSIKAISEYMYDDFVQLLDSFKVKKKNIAMISVYHNYQQIKSLLNKFSDTFTQEHLDILVKYGIKGFSLNNGLVQKHLLAELQSIVNGNLFNRETAKTYRSSFAWLMREFDIPFNDIYPIKLTKTVKHNQRLNTDDFYTEEQCRELAFYIEKLLRDERTSLYHRILLHVGKIILKTAWNIAPLLNLECTDIVEVLSPLTNKEEYAIVLQKARAGYRNDTYLFDKSALKADTLKSAISDLLIVRDELTRDLRKRTKHSNFIFIFPRNNRVLKLEYSSIKQLSRILNNAGCRVNFVAQKIRKGGVNHIYRKVSKNIKKSTGITKHSYDTFESNYLRIDPNQARYSLNQATKVMADYFLGKEISPEICIITDESTSQHQLVPSGNCAAQVNNKEASRYDKEHRKLHQIIDDKDRKLCADFLSCIWCKYFRVVVDAEHVWKLLSYKNYILLNMEMSVVDLDDSNHQITSINILKQRVDEIIDNLRDRNEKAVSEGFKLLEKQGMHPDWEFAFPLMTMVKENSNG